MGENNARGVIRLVTSENISGLLSDLHLNLKYLKFFSTVLTSSLALILFLPGFWRYVILSLLLPSPTSSIYLSPLVSSILDKN